MHNDDRAPSPPQPEPGAWTRAMAKLGLAPQDTALVGTVVLMLVAGLLNDKGLRGPTLLLLLASLISAGAWVWIVHHTGWFSTRGGRVHRDEQPLVFWLILVGLPVALGAAYVYFFRALFPG